MKKVAIVRRNGLGDLLCTLPLISYLQNMQYDVTLFVDERNAPLLPYLPSLGKTVILPTKGNKYFNLLKIALRYRFKRFDIALSAKTSPMKLINLFLFVLGAKKRIAYVEPGWHRHLINAPLRFNFKESKRKHQALKVLQMMVPKFSEVPKEFYPKVIVPQKVEEQYPNLIEKKLPRLLISASTTRPSNRFDETRYAAIINRLYNEVALFEVVILGQPKDELRAKALVAQLTVPYVLHFPRNFEEFMVLMKSSDLFFVGDGGIAHIAAAMDKKVLVLFGESTPIEWAPLGMDVTTLYDPIHVNRLKDDKILATLKAKLQEVVNGRESARNSDRLDTSQPVSTA